MAKEAGFPGIHFVGRVDNPSLTSMDMDLASLYDKGYDALSIPRLGLMHDSGSFISKISNQIRSLVKYNGCRHVVQYKDEIKHYINPDYDTKENIYPVIYPNWDHSPRSGKNCLIVTGSTPKLFKSYIKKVVDLVTNKQPQHKIVFLKSWNEWGEGNYIEPDLVYGDGYLTALKETLVID